MKKIGSYYIVPEDEMKMIQWWLALLDRHREQDRQKQTELQEQPRGDRE